MALTDARPPTARAFVAAADAAQPPLGGGAARYAVLDGFRGFFLVFMLVAHANEFLVTVLFKFHHHYVGWVQDAQGFILISGLVVGLVYGKILRRGGTGAMVRAIFARWRTIYFWHALLVLMLAVTVLVLPPTIPDWLLKPFSDQPLGFTIGSLLLISSSDFMGILPMYLIFIAATPFVLIALHRGQLLAVAIGSIGLWLIAQTPLPDMAIAALERPVLWPGEHIALGLSFDLLGWQILYVIGLCAGYAMCAGTLDLDRLKRPEFENAFWVAAAVIVVLGLFRRAMFAPWLPEDMVAPWLAANSRDDFAGIYLFAFLIDLYAFTWLIVAGGTARSAVLRQVSRLVRWVFTHPALVLLGRHSLQVFAYHIVLVYVLSVIIGPKDPPEIWADLWMSLAILSLFLPAFAHAAWQRRHSRGAAVEPPAVSASAPLNDEALDHAPLIPAGQGTSA